MFYNLTVKAIKRETPDTVSVSFEVPDNLKEIFQYTQGQYLTFKKTIAGEEVRRSYSLSSSPALEEDLRVAIKKIEGGKFSSYANDELKVGDVLETMAPMGGFYTQLQKFQTKQYVLFAAGSGITPILSIIKTILEVEENSSCVLVYGNRDSEHTIYKTELDELRANHSDRFELSYIFSRQQTSTNTFMGRIDAGKCEELVSVHDKLYQGSEYFLCGPEEMINAVSEHLQSQGVDKDKVHFELFTTPVASAEKVDTGEEVVSQVTVIMDDEEFEFELSNKGDFILDAAVDAGADAPFSCKGAVCCTCKAKVVEGSAMMEMNYALTDDEVEQGYILTCQARPSTETLTVDYDVI